LIRSTAATTDPGASKFASVCQDCHGPRGQGLGRFPKLAGRPAVALASREVACSAWFVVDAVEAIARTAAEGTR